MTPEQYILWQNPEDAAAHLLRKHNLTDEYTDDLDNGMDGAAARFMAAPTPGHLAVQVSDGRWEWAEHLMLLSMRLAETLLLGGLRLIVMAPPRHGKSELISKWLPVWTLHQAPQWSVILGSYAAEFAAFWGRQVRNISDDERNASRLAFRLSPDSKAANRWNTSAEGGMITAGIGGQVTGRGGDVLLLDDPIKNVQEASSDLVLQNQWAWWGPTFYTRCEPGASIIVIMTHWDDKDIAGRLIADAKMGGEHWDVMSMPAIAEAADDMMGRKIGEALWPERYTAKALDQIKRSVGSYTWAALYQQRPAPLEGGLFKRPWFDVVPKMPKGCERVRYWDMAGTEARAGTDPDYTVGTLMGLAEESGLEYVADVRRFRQSAARSEHLVRHQAKMDGPDVPIRMEQEPGSSGKHSIATYAKLLRGFDFQGIPSTRSKVERARPFSAASENGLVCLVEGEWINAWLHEVETFPTGKHDDQVDSASGAHGFLSGTLGEHTPRVRVTEVSI